MNQSKGTGKVVGAVFAGIGAIFNGFLTFIFGSVGIIYSANPASVDVTVNGVEYTGQEAIEIAQMAAKISFGIAIFTLIVTIALIFLCVKLSKDYKKLNAVQPQPYGAMGYNQYQANPYAARMQNQYAQGAQNPYQNQ